MAVQTSLICTLTEKKGASVVSASEDKATPLWDPKQACVGAEKHSNEGAFFWFLGKAPPPVVGSGRISGRDVMKPGGTDSGPSLLTVPQGTL